MIRKNEREKKQKDFDKLKSLGVALSMSGDVRNKQTLKRIVLSMKGSIENRPRENSSAQRINDNSRKILRDGVKT
jgi:hypothetical protein